MVIVRQLMIRRRRAAGVTAISTAGSLCGRSAAFVTISGALSLHLKIPFPVANLGGEVRAHLKSYWRFCTAAVIRDLGSGAAAIPD
jgi:hypothetical protein